MLAALYRQTQGPNHVERVIDACAIATTNPTGYTLYSLLCAICAPGTPHNGIMQTCFAIINPRMHFNPTAQYAEIRTPGINSGMFPDYVSILFVVREQQLTVVNEFCTKVLGPLCGEFLMVWPPTTSRPPPQTHDGHVCHRCLDSMQISDTVRRCVDSVLLPSIQDGGNEVSHMMTFKSPVHVPPPSLFLPIVMIQTFMDQSDLLFPQRMFAHPPLSNLFAAMSRIGVNESWALTLTIRASTAGAESRLLVSLYSQALGLWGIGNFHSVQNKVLSVLAGLGLFSSGGQWSDVVRRCANLVEFADQSKFLDKCMTPFVVGRNNYSFAEAREAILTRPTTITPENVEMLSMLSMNCVWLLRDFTGNRIQLGVDHAHDIRHSMFDYLGRVSLLCFASEIDDTFGEHAGCMGAGDTLFKKWQLFYAFEIASIEPITPPEFTGTDDLSKALSKLMTTLAPTHSVTLVENCSIGREYANFNAVARITGYEEFFVVPVFACVIPTTDFITRAAKRSPETHFRTSFAEFVLFTLYANFGITLRQFCAISIFQHPFKAVLNLCVLFIARYQATGTLWSDMHENNLTVRLLNKATTLRTPNSDFTLDFAPNEQIISAIDHGDDTPSRVVLEKDINEQACRVFITTVRALIAISNVDFTVDSPQPKADIHPTLLTLQRVLPQNRTTGRFDSEKVPMHVYRQSGVLEFDQREQPGKSYIQEYKLMLRYTVVRVEQLFHFRTNYQCAEALQQAAEIFSRDVFTIDAIIEATKTLIKLLKPVPMLFTDI